MRDVTILIVEDHEKWQTFVSKTLQKVGTRVHIDVAADLPGALASIARNVYDLVIADLALTGDPLEPEQDEPLIGMAFLRALRGNPLNQLCGLIILTAHPTLERVAEALRDRGADNFFAKSNFDHVQFEETARAVLFETRVRRAAARDNAQYKLTISHTTNSITDVELKGPAHQATYTIDNPAVADADQRFTDIVRRTNNLNILVAQKNTNIWRTDARAIGRDLYRWIDLADKLATARTAANRSDDVWLQFRGPALGLGIPFELLHDDQEYLCLRHLLTRRTVHTSTHTSRKPQPFHEFLEKLWKHNEPLRVLIVGATISDDLPAVAKEVKMLAETITEELQHISINVEVDTLIGRDATYLSVRNALQRERYHLFHYAGHGQFNADMPEMSGLILHDERGSYTLTASDLSILVQDTDLRLVFLSCCLSARTASATQAEHGDFYGTLEALARADVPIVLGYRWTVPDASAQVLAHVFYQTLWHTFSPADALLQARRDTAMGSRGRNDDTWASPVLLMQNV